MGVISLYTEIRSNHLSDRRRKRRPGGGRKPIDPQGAVIAPVRFTRDEWEAINRAGKKYGLKRSQAIRVAAKYWLGMVQYPQLHVAAFTYLITILIKRIESRTGRKWTEDPKTASAVREEIGCLIDGFAPAAKKGFVSPELRGIARDLIVITAHLYREPRPSLALAGDDWAPLAVIAKDLGPTLLRKVDKTVVAISEVKS
jgi:hypothetical protein